MTDRRKWDRAYAESDGDHAGYVRRYVDRPSLADVLADVLDEYEEETRKLPYQHEIKEHGCCSYNWRMAVIRDLRAKLALRNQGEPNGS